MLFISQLMQAIQVQSTILHMNKLLLVQQVYSLPLLHIYWIIYNIQIVMFHQQLRPKQFIPMIHFLNHLLIRIYLLVLIMLTTIHSLMTMYNISYNTFQNHQWDTSYSYLFFIHYYTYSCHSSLTYTGLFFMLYQCIYSNLWICKTINIQ